MNYFEARYVYDRERQSPHRNYATDHSFDEWWDLRAMRTDNVHVEEPVHATNPTPHQH